MNRLNDSKLSTNQYFASGQFARNVYLPAISRSIKELQITILYLPAIQKVKIQKASNLNFCISQRYESKTRWAGVKKKKMLVDRDSWDDQSDSKLSYA
jgi:hypothetical protein